MPPKSKRARTESSSDYDESYDDENEAGPSVQHYENSAVDKKSWQQTTDTIGERDGILLKSNEFTDITFIVGRNKKKISCHRVYLAKTSPTFASMFYGKKKTTDSEIKMPDVTPEAFKVLLQYIYTGIFDVKKLNYDSAWEILYAAKKFAMPDTIIALLHSYIRKKVMVSMEEQAVYSKTKNDKIKRAWPTIQHAVENGEEELLEVTWQVIESKTSKALKHDNFVDVSPAILETLVKKDSLKCTENELFQACIKWAKYEARRKNIEPEPQNLRQILNPILPYIRFLTFDPETFSDGPARSGILTKSEISSIVTPTSLGDLPKTICSVSTIRKKKRYDSFYAFGEPRLPNAKINANKESNFPTYETTWVQFQCESNVLVGVKVPSQIKKIDGNHSEYYQEDLTVHIVELDNKDPDCDPKTNCVKNFHGKVKYNSVIDIKLGCKTGAGMYGTTGSATIIFHKSGRYPYQCPDIDGKFDQDSDNEDVKYPISAMKLEYGSSSYMTVYHKNQSR